MPIKYGKRGSRRKVGNTTFNYGADGQLKSTTYKNKGSKLSRNDSLTGKGSKLTINHGGAYYTQIGGAAKKERKSKRRKAGLSESVGCALPLLVFVALMAGAVGIA